MSKGKKGQSRRRRNPDGASPLRRPPSSYGDRSTRVVYIAAEGARTERDYVQLLDQTYGAAEDREPFRLHFCHPGHDNGLRPDEVVDQVLDRAQPGDEMWALFDRDKEDNRDRAIRDAMSRAARRGVQVAFSHPSFELWLLLHFQHFTSQEHGISEVVLDRLRRHPDAKGFAEYDKASGKRGKGLAGQRWESLTGREGTALRNARKLVDRCPHGGCAADGATSDTIGGKAPEKPAEWTKRSGHAPSCDPLLRDPSTDVWRLLVSLGLGTG